MADTRGVFGLKLARILKGRGDWTPLDQVWSAPSPLGPTLSPNTGYYVAGNDPHVTIVDKITYSNDTTARVPSANLPQAKNRIAAVGSQTAAYVGGGHPSEASFMQKITYATDTSALTPTSGYLTVGRMGPTATGTSTAGYFGGGYKTFGPNEVTTVDKITYSSDTTAQVPGASLSEGRYSLAAAGNTTAGYFGGGRNENNQDQSRIDKLVYSNETTTYTPGANLTAARRYLAATGNSNFGYFVGNVPASASMDKTTYASDTTAAAPGANLALANSYLAATTSISAGYFSGGYVGGTVFSRVEKTTYSTDTTAYTPGANLPIANYSHAGASPRANALPESVPVESFNTGYFGGGYVPASSPSSTATVEKTNFANDTTATVPNAALSAARGMLTATGNMTHGYFGGGLGDGPAIATMDKTSYANDTTAAAPGANLTVARRAAAAAGNLSAGYFGGGTPGPVSRMDKLTYASDTTAVLPSTGALSSNRQAAAATGTTTAGYFGGGTPGPVSRMDKLTYSTDTLAFTPGANLSGNRYGSGATGNSTVGYFGGGYAGSSGFSTVDKVTYSTDTTARVPGANLTVKRANPGATGNSTDGYFMSGDSFPAPSSDRYRTSVDKLSYSTETAAEVPGAAGSLKRFKLGASGSKAYGFGTAPGAPAVRFSDGSSVVALPDAGYITGGYASPHPGVRTTRVRLSTDTSTYVPSANMTSVRQNFATTSSLTTGYIAGGGPSSQSNAQKIPYADDTTVFLPSVNIQPRSEVGGNGTDDNGYFSGGSPGSRSWTSRIQYSNDSSSLIPGAYLTTGRRYMDRNTLGNVTHGHLSGGYDSSNTALSSSERLTYSTETTAVLPGANLVNSVPNYLMFLGVGDNTSGYAVHFNGTVQKITYSSGTFAVNPSAALGHTRSQATGFGGNGAGYITGGENPAVSPSFLTSMQKLSYSTDTTSTLPSGANLTGFKYSGSNGMSPFDTGTEDKRPPTATPTPSTFASTPNQAVFAGGTTSSTPPATEKFLYSNETFSQIPATLTAARYGHASVSSPSVVYFGGGYAPYPIFDTTIVDKYTYSNDSISRSPSSNLSDPRKDLAAVGNETHGYFGGGGYQGNYRTVVDRITFSSGSRSRIPGANLSYRRRQLSACGNLTAGYFIGGFNNNDNPTVPERAASNVDKLTYASDTSVAVPGAFTPVGVYRHDSTGSPSVGYIGGGAKLPSSTEQQFDKLTYSTDTTASAPGITFSSYEVNYGAVSNTDAAYFTINNPAVLKLTFSSDTLSTIPATSSTTQRKVGSGARDNGIGLSPNII